MNSWNSFFSVIAESSATLTGLIFVGVSISLTRILELPKLPSRALNALFLLANILIISVLCLVPDPPDAFIASEILIIAITTFTASFILNIDVIRGINIAYKGAAIRSLLLTQIAIAPFIIGGIAIFSQGNTAFYWFIPGIIFSIIKAIADAWVLLIEIHR